jgi:hypothetical protein
MHVRFNVLCTPMHGDTKPWGRDTPSPSPAWLETPPNFGVENKTGKHANYCCVYLVLFCFLLCPGGKGLRADACGGSLHVEKIIR